MNNRLTATSKLYLLIIIMAVFFAGMGLYGFYAMKRLNENTKTIYNDRMVAIEELTTVRYQYSANILSIFEQVKDGKISFGEAFETVQLAEILILKNWNNYITTYLTEDEKHLAVQTDKMIRQSTVTIDKLKMLLKGKNSGEFDSIIKNELYAALNPIIFNTNDLVQLQLKVGDEVYKNSEQVYKTSSGKFFLIFLLTLFLAIPVILTLARDISEHVKALSALQKSEEKFHSLIDHAADAIFMITDNGVIFDVNRHASELLQYSKTELIGMSVLQLHPEEVLPGIPLIWDKLRQERSLADDRFLKRKDGSLVKVEINRKMLPDSSGAIAIVRDITERVKAQEAIQQSTEKLRQLTGHLLNIREEERMRIGRELHDELGQQLTAMKMDISWINKKTGEEHTEVKSKLKNTLSLLDGSNISISRILNELRPVILDEYGLVEAIKWQGQKFTVNTNIPVEFTLSETQMKIAEEISICLFRVYEESLTNITRHSHAKRVFVSMKIADENIIMTVEDDGKGFDTSSLKNKKSFGILGMRERVFALHGSFDLVSVPKKGTMIQVSIPLNNNI